MDHYSPTQAPARIDYDPAAAIAEIRYAGSVTADGLDQAHEALLMLIDGRAVLGLVIDVRDSIPAYSPGQALESMESCVADMALERVAVLAGPGRDRLIMLMETVAFGHGVRVRAFDDLDEARRFASGV